jgi:hypothetical protein
VKTSEKAKRKRARYVAATIGMVLRQYEHLDPDSPIGYLTTIGQMRFIRAMLNRAAR